MRSDDRGRFEKAIDKLIDAPEKSRKETRRRLNSQYLVEFHEPGAPDPNDYPEDEIDRYVFELHEWALTQYAEAVDELQAAADIDVETYPELGVDRPSDRDERARQKQQVVDVAEALSRVDEVRDWLDQIETEWNER